MAPTPGSNPRLPIALLFIHSSEPFLPCHHVPRACHDGVTPFSSELLTMLAVEGIEASSRAPNSRCTLKNLSLCQWRNTFQGERSVNLTLIRSFHGTGAGTHWKRNRWRNGMSTVRCLSMQTPPWTKSLPVA